ncbi:aliphatic sulfonate ABC transporter substrate-binding protein [Silvimonas amylolytica]|uniref:Aliphatic sulfonate ABC transporter substrate-binding protein n=1 Tax=Silvimonas amylolytica TaxID=449663 RepID=A0ABQ2PT58_9NEIS|nr:aliphatic sulfonate ABC transporter substrate-binding protein [Silvimonas amylolytica]GGP28124.1 aliphatic sulfonate ABC transporter substrate-binding protein [Silvimonas amylolytica]
MRDLCKFLSGAVLLSAGLASPLAHASEKLKIGYNNWVGSAGVFVAQEKGFFKQAGVDVEFVPFKGPSDAIPPLVSGHIDLALTTADNVVLVNARSGTDLKIIYATDTSNGADAVVSKKGLTSLADLKGKTVAVTQNEVNELLLLKGLEKAGMKPGDIKSVNMDPDSAGAAFVAGKVDAAVTWEPWISQAVAGGGKVVFSSAQVPNLILDVVTVNPATSKTKAKAIAAFLAAVDKGTAFVRSNPDEAMPLVAKRLEVKPGEVKDMLVGVKLYDMAGNAKLLHGPVAAQTLDNISVFYSSRKTIPKTLKGSDMVDASFVQLH